jgi:superfamily II DNA or RNA helicase
MTKIIVGNNRCKLMSLQDDEILRELDTRLSYMVQGFQFMNVRNNWDGRHRLLDRKGFFPVGMLPTVESILRKNGHPYQIVDNRPPLNYQNKMVINPKSGFEHRDYQVELIDAAWKHKGGIVRAATGAGKTFCIASIAAKFGVKTIVYVIGIELLYQMKGTFMKAYPHLNVGMVGDGNCDIGDITIMTIWSAAAAFNQKVKLTDSDLTNDSARKNKNLNKALVQKAVKDAELFILDECQYAASQTVQFLDRVSVNARHRFLLSGTPWRESGDDLLIEAVGGPKFFDMSATKLINAGWLVKPEIHFINVPLKRGIGKKYHEVYENFIVENEDRNGRIIAATKKLVASGKKCLILVTKLSHGKKLLGMLEQDLRVASLDGSNKTVDRLAAIKSMQDGDLDVLVASKIFDQGIDIPQLDALILAGSGKSSARALQRIGRVIRNYPGKEKAIVVDFYDNCKFLREHSKARLKVYKTEPGFQIKMPRKK